MPRCLHFPTSKIEPLLLPAFFLALPVFAEIGSRCPDYVTRHAPIVWLHSEDAYKPSDLLTHVKLTTPMLDGQAISDLPPLDLNNLELLNEYGDRVALTSNEDPTAHPEYLLGEVPDKNGQIHNATPCVVVVVEKTPRDVDAFYFYFYSYDQGPNITQVMEPLNRLVSGDKAASGLHFGNHIGDWEHNMVRFHDGKPTGVYFSQHVDGEAYGWDDPTLTKVDERPVVYSALGSHANYPSQGVHVHDIVLLDFCDRGKKWDPTLSAYFLLFNVSDSTVASLDAPSMQATSDNSSSTSPTSFFYYNGIWGDSRYPDADPRQESVPYFGLKRFESGPTGPSHKHLVRKGLRPDERRKRTWLEYVITIFMSFYPCCIKGWRVWVFLGIFVTILAAFAVCFIFLAKRLMALRARKTYQRVEADEFLLEEWHSDEESFGSEPELEIEPEPEPKDDKTKIT